MRGTTWRNFWTALCSVTGLPYNSRSATTQVRRNTKSSIDSPSLIISRETFKFPVAHLRLGLAHALPSGESPIISQATLGVSMAASTRIISGGMPVRMTERACQSSHLSSVPSRTRQSPAACSLTYMKSDHSM